MSFREKVNEFFKKNLSIRRLTIVILSLAVVLLVLMTSDVWVWIFSKLQTILLPFILGFGIAYILHPITRYFERFNIKRQIIVPVTLIVFVVFIVLLMSSIMPKLVTDITTIISSSVEGIQKLFNYYLEVSNGTPEPWVNDLFNEAMKMLKGLISSIPTIPSFASNIVGGFISFLTTTLFSLVIGLYFIFDYEDFTHKVLSVANYISPKLGNSIIVINRAVLQYLQSLIVIMAITFVEYTLLYTLIGHNYALILGVMAAIALLIPYIGPISVQVLGALTSLTLPLPRVVGLVIGLVVLSNIDNYLISPMVYSKRDKVDPLSSLFIFFAASTLFGFMGVLLSMPIYFSIRAVFQLKKQNWQLP